MLLFFSCESCGWLPDNTSDAVFEPFIFPKCSALANSSSCIQWVVCNWSSGKLCQSMPEPRVPRKRTVDCQNWTCDRACRKAGLWPLVIWFIDGFPSCFQAERSLHVLHVDCVWPLHVFIHVVLSWRIWHSIKKFQCRHWRLCGFAVSHVHRICSACCCWHETQEVLQGHTRHLSRNISGQLWRQTALCNVLCFHHLWVEPDFAIFCQCV